jgi:zinc protease
VEAQAPVRLYETPVAGSPAIDLAAVIRAGSAFDPVGSEGIAALTARAMKEAGAGARTPDDVRTALLPTGNELQLVVDREWVSFRLRCHPDHATLCIDLFADVLAQPSFGEADVQRLRDDAIHAVTDGLRENDEALGWEVLQSVLYEGHPYGHPVDGRAGVLPLLGPAETRAFHAAHYVRESTVVGIAGGYSSEDRDHLAARLDEIPARRAPDDALFEPPPVSGRSIVAVDTQTPVTGIHFGHPIAVDRNHADWPALYLATHALGSHRQSFGRLFGALRAERGLNYGDYAYVEHHVERRGSSAADQAVVRRDNAFTVWIRPTSIDDGPLALELAISEVERWVNDGLTQEELDDVRSWLLGSLAVQTPDAGWKQLYALEAAASGTPDLLTYLPGVLPDLALEDVNAAIARHVRPADLRIVAVTGEAEAFVATLRSEEHTSLGMDVKSMWVVSAEGLFR